MPLNAWLRLTRNEPTLAVVPLVPTLTVPGLDIEKSGICMVTPLYTATRISSPGANRLPNASTAIPAELPLMIATWSLGSGGVVTGGNIGPGYPPSRIHWACMSLRVLELVEAVTPL